MKKQTLKALALVVALGAICTAAQADVGKTSAYVESTPAAPVVKNAFGECWHTGTWTKEQAVIEGCDGYVKAAPAPAPVAAKPAPAPVPAVAPAAAKPQVFTLKGDVLFDLDKSSLKPKGKEALDNLYNDFLSAKAHEAKLTVKGYADRLGSEKYNLKLSDARAKTVAAYLANKGFDKANITGEGFGEANPVTGSDCNKIKQRAKLVACLAPDRRVEIELDGTK